MTHMLATNRFSLWHCLWHKHAVRHATLPQIGRFAVATNDSNNLGICHKCHISLWQSVTHMLATNCPHVYTIHAADVATAWQLWHVADHVADHD